jgi:hypothetical protein
MATIILIGGDTPLLEGVAQMLAALGHRSHHVTSVEEGMLAAAAQPPLMVVVAHDLASARGDLARFPLEPGGALVLYRTRPGAATPLPHALLRTTLADLLLPLERQRLSALVQHVEERARVAGRRRSGAREALGDLPPDDLPAR